MTKVKPNSNVARQQMKPLTPEEKKEQLIRAFMQKKDALAEGILFNMVQGCGGMFTLESFNEDDLLKMVGIADKMSTEFMRVVYNQEMKVENED